MTQSSEVRIKDIGLSRQALEAITAAAPHLRTSTPSVRKVIEELTAAKLLATPGVGPQTVAEIEDTMRRECGVGFIDYRSASVSKPTASAEAPKTAKRARKRAS